MSNEDPFQQELYGIKSIDNGSRNCSPYTAAELMRLKKRQRWNIFNWQKHRAFDLLETWKVEPKDIHDLSEAQESDFFHHVFNNTYFDDQTYPVIKKLAFKWVTQQKGRDEWPTTQFPDPGTNTQTGSNPPSTPEHANDIGDRESIIAVSQQPSVKSRVKAIERGAHHPSASSSATVPNNSAPSETQFDSALREEQGISANTTNNMKVSSPSPESIIALQGQKSSVSEPTDILQGTATSAELLKAPFASSASHKGPQGSAAAHQPCVEECHMETEQAPLNGVHRGVASDSRLNNGAVLIYRHRRAIRAARQQCENHYDRYFEEQHPPS